MDLLALALSIVIVVAVFSITFLALGRTGFTEVERRANERAAAVVRQFLTEPELAQLKRAGVLDIASRAQPGRVYQVRASGTRVTVFDDGKPIAELCIRPRTVLPGNEHVVAHKLMIQAAEDEYNRRANVMWRAGGATVAGRSSWFD
jgi:hypothetical protein